MTRGETESNRNDKEIKPFYFHLPDPNQIDNYYACFSAFDEEEDEKKKEAAVVPTTNEEFFLDYTKEEYIKFASRTDVVAPPVPSQEEEETTENYTRKEFSFNSFKRSLKLPASADLEVNVNATYKKGILQLQLAKKEAVKTSPEKQIKIS